MPCTPGMSTSHWCPLPHPCPPAPSSPGLTSPKGIALIGAAATAWLISHYNGLERLGDVIGGLWELISGMFWLMAGGIFRRGEQSSPAEDTDPVDEVADGTPVPDSSSSPSGDSVAQAAGVTVTVDDETGPPPPSLLEYITSSWGDQMTVPNLFQPDEGLFFTMPTAVAPIRNGERLQPVKSVPGASSGSEDGNFVGSAEVTSKKVSSQHENAHVAESEEQSGFAAIPVDVEVAT